MTCHCFTSEGDMVECGACEEARRHREEGAASAQTRIGALEAELARYKAAVPADVTELEKTVGEHIWDLTTGRLPIADVTSNIVEDFRRALESLAAENARLEGKLRTAEETLASCFRADEVLDEHTKRLAVLEPFIDEANRVALMLAPKGGDGLLVEAERLLDRAAELEAENARLKADNAKVQRRLAGQRHPPHREASRRMTPYDVPCRACGAPAGHRCCKLRWPNGQPTKPHAERRRDANPVPTRRDLLIVIGRLQDLVGEAKARLHDHNPDREAQVRAALDAAHDLAVHARSQEPPVTESGYWAMCLRRNLDVK